jgi:catechol 2,3-dioxygenase-like lactoylglutathione lyase family enzyme
MVEGLDGIEAITLFAEDLATARRFYEEVFGLSAVFEDAVSAAYRLGPQLLNVLHASQAPELVTPLAIGAADQGPRLMFTIHVASVDAICAQLAGHGVTLLNGPVDRPWGRRTAAFRDPAGIVWEIAHDL